MVFFPFYWAASEFCTDIYSTSCWGVIVCLVIMSFTYKEEANTEDVNCRNLKLRKKI